MSGRGGSESGRDRDWADLTPAVLREIRKARLTKAEALELDELKERVRARLTTGEDVKNLSPRPLLEARLKGDRRTFRLLYAERAEGLVLVAVLFTTKKSRRLSPQVFETAEWRLRAWDEANGTGL